MSASIVTRAAKASLVCSFRAARSTPRVARSFATSAISQTDTTTSSSNAPPSALSSDQTRAKDSSSKPPPSSGNGNKDGSNGKGIRLPLEATLYVLLTTSVLLTGIGVYQFYKLFQTWPEEMREDLRAAVKFRRDGEWKASELKFRSAIATAHSLDPEALGDTETSLRKMTGLWIALASMLEESHQIDKAYVAFNEGFKLSLTDASTNSVEGRSGPERARAVAISQKLGELALKIADLGPNSTPSTVFAALSPAEKVLRGLRRKQTPRLAGLDEQDSGVEVQESPFETRKQAAEAAETHLVWSVEELLRLTLPSEILNEDTSERGQAQESGTEATPTTVTLAELDLPPWVTQTDLLASLESLGTFYARAGQTKYAVPLYMQALEFLIPTNPSSRAMKPQSSITISDRCRACVIMNNLSQVYLEGNDYSSSPEYKKARDARGGKVGHSTAWAKRALDLVQDTNGKAGWGLTDEKSPSAVEKIQGSENLVRAQQVKAECIFAEIAVLINLGTLSQMADDKCAARNYLQRAYRLADQEGYRDARIRAARILRSLERR